MTEPNTAPTKPPQSKIELFTGFFKLSAVSFGGVGPMARHVVVVERRWIDERDYAETLGLCQALPGANICNLAVMVGDRFFGVQGAIAALAGLLLPPLLAISLLIRVYEQFAGSPTAQSALTGAVAAAAGLTFATAIRLLMTLGKTARVVFVALGAFVMVGVLRISLVAVVIVITAISYVWWLQSESQ